MPGTGLPPGTSGTTYATLGPNACLSSAGLRTSAWAIGVTTAGRSATVDWTVGPRGPRRGDQQPRTDAGPVNKNGGNRTDSRHGAHRRLHHRGSGKPPLTPIRPPARWLPRPRPSRSAPRGLLRPSRRCYVSLQRPVRLNCLSLSGRDQQTWAPDLNCRHAREGVRPGAVLHLETDNPLFGRLNLDSRLRGNDGLGGSNKFSGPPDNPPVHTFRFATP